MTTGRQLLFARWIPGAPVPQTRPRVVAGRVFHDRRSDAHRKHLVQFLRMASSEVGDAGRPEQLIEQPVLVRITLYGARQTSDLDNHAKQVLDALVQAWTLVDDDLGVVRGLEIEVAGSLSERREGTLVEVWTFHERSVQDKLRGALVARGQAADPASVRGLMGSRTAIARELRSAIVSELVEAGYTQREVAGACGLDPATVRRICATAHLFTNATQSRRATV